MKIPQSNTARYKVYKAIYDHAPVKLQDLILRLPKVSRETIRTALQVGRENGILCRDGFDWSATDAAKKYFDDLEIQPKDGFIPQIVPPRITNVWTPEMKGYEANLMRLRRAA